MTLLKDQIIDLIKRNPGMKAAVISERVGCDAHYVHMVMRKNGLRSTYEGWSREQEALLRELWPEHTVSDIAQTLGMTKGRVSGRAWRLGLTKRGPNKPKPRRETKAPAQKRVFNKIIVPQLRKVPVKEIPETIEPKRISILELNNSTCRFPLGHPGHADFAYCGLEGADLASCRPYCPHHHVRSVSGTATKPIVVPGMIKPSSKTFEAFDRAQSR